MPNSSYDDGIFVELEQLLKQPRLYETSGTPTFATKNPNPNPTTITNIENTKNSALSNTDHSSSNSDREKESYIALQTLLASLNDNPQLTSLSKITPTQTDKDQDQDEQNQIKLIEDSEKRNPPTTYSSSDGAKQSQMVSSSTNESNSRSFSNPLSILSSSHSAFPNSTGSRNSCAPSTWTKNQVLKHLNTVINFNERYRANLEEKLHLIERWRKRNARMQDKLLRLIKTTLKRREHKLPPTLHHKLAVFGINPGSKKQPIPNQDKVRKLSFTLKTASSIKGASAWTSRQIKQLRDTIKEYNQKALFLKLAAKYQDVDNENSLMQFKSEMEQIREMDFEQLLQKNSGEIDWDKVCLQVKGRTSKACELYWKNWLDACVNKGTWTKSEDMHLLVLARKYHNHSWVKIARELNTNRTAEQCLMRFQRSLNPKMIRNKWEPAEDNTLKSLVHQFGVRNWQTVCQYLPGRTPQQCLHRYTKCLGPNIRRGKWNASEDRRLIMSRYAFESNKWRNIAHHVPGRTDVQCRERYCNILNPKLTNTPWTSEEDNKLILSIENRGKGKWAAIARDLYPRTDNQCWRRWKTLTTKSDVSNYRATRKKLSQGLMANFSGRSKERPSFSMADFAVTPMAKLTKRKRPTITNDETPVNDGEVSETSDSQSNKRTRQKD